MPPETTPDTIQAALLSEIETLDQAADATDNAQASVSIKRITEQIIALITAVASKARRMLRPVLLVLLLGIGAGAFTAYYFVAVAGWHVAWAALPITLVALPSIVLALGLWVLCLITALPRNIGDIGDAVAQIARKHLHELHLLAERGRGLLRFRSYILLAKILWKINDVRGQTGSTMRAAYMLPIIANPLFWAVIAVAMALLVIETVVMLLACGVHAVLF